MPMFRAPRAERAVIAALFVASLAACSDDNTESADVGVTDTADIGDLVD